jgi:hypothetical protein
MQRVKNFKPPKFQALKRRATRKMQSLPTLLQMRLIPAIKVHHLRRLRRAPLPMLEPQVVHLLDQKVVEGVIVEQGAVLAMGVFLSATTKIINRETGEVHVGRVPPYSVVVPGAMPGPVGTPSLYCAVIVKQVDARTRAKTAINELLRY